MFLLNIQHVEGVNPFHSLHLGDAGLHHGRLHHVCRVGGLELLGQRLLLRHFVAQGKHA